MCIQYFVLWLAFTAVALADSGNPNPVAPVEDSKCNSNETVAVIRNITSDMEMCVESLILHTPSNISSCSEMKNWNNYKQPIVNALLCSEKNKTELERAFDKVSALVNFTFEESREPNFIDLWNKTKACYNHTKTQIQNCTKTELGLTNVTIRSTDYAWLIGALTDTNIKSACDDARRLQKCVLDCLEKSAHCPPETRNFTKSLFVTAENVHQCNYGNKTGDHESQKGNVLTAGGLSTVSIVFIVLGVLLTVTIIIALVYKAKCRKN